MRRAPNSSDRVDRKMEVEHNCASGSQAEERRRSTPGKISEPERD
jgi:hypothetical protein